MISRVVFFNVFQNGDVHSNKEFVRQFIQELDKNGIESCYTTNVPAKSVNLPVRHAYMGEEFPWLNNNSPSYIDGDTLYINTWVGHYITMETHNFAAQIPMWTSLSELLRFATDGIVDVKIYDDLLKYVSVIDDTETYNLNIPDGAKVLMCNNQAMSGQAHNGDWSGAINALAFEFPSVKFICTRKFNHQYTNILFTDDVTGRVDGQSDLPEIAFFSEHCDMIVTNSSGPGTFAMTRNNFTNKDMSIIAFVIGPGNTFWNGIPGVNADVSWHPVFDDISVLNIVRDKVNEKIYSNSGRL